MAREEITLFSFNYPEVMGSTCVTGWTWVPCPTWRNPGRMCRQEIQAPCVKRRTSKFRVYAYVEYPDSIEDYIKKEIENCHRIAARVAATIIVTAATSSATATPAAQISAAIAAIPSALQAYIKAFWDCITSFSLSDSIGRQLVYDIEYENYKLNDWH